MRLIRPSWARAAGTAQFTARRDPSSGPPAGPRGGCPTGEARVTPGYGLRARYVIHTVGPVWSGGTQSEPELLRRCYLGSLGLAGERDVRSIALPGDQHRPIRLPDRAGSGDRCGRCARASQPRDVARARAVRVLQRGGSGSVSAAPRRVRPARAAATKCATAAPPPLTAPIPPPPPTPAPNR